MGRVFGTAIFGLSMLGVGLILNDGSNLSVGVIGLFALGSVIGVAKIFADKFDTLARPDPGAGSKA